MRRLLRAFFLFQVAILWAGVALGQSTSMDALQKSYSDFYTAAASDRYDPVMRALLDALEWDAREVIRPGFLRSDGTWTDINYAEVPSGSWSPWDHFRRMTVMARAYSTPGQGLYRDGQLLTLLEAALNQLPSFYGTTSKSPPGNWWFWVIGPALDLGPTLVLVRNDISLSTLSTASGILRTRIGSSPWMTPSGSPLEGQNLIWSALNHTALAILMKDPARMQEAQRVIASMCVRYTGRDGLQGDSSFQQHGPQIYNGGYGAAFAADVARYALITRESTYELPPTELGVFADYVADGIAWTLFQNHFDVSVVGREVAKPTTSGWNGFAALLQMSSVDTTRRTVIARAAVRMMESWIGPYPVELAGLASSLERSGLPGAWPGGHLYFYASDHTIHRRPSYFASVKMLSTRTRSGERTNGENLLGARQSDGRFYLTLRGDEYFSNHVWPSLDWTRLPGTTVEQRPDAATGSYGTGNRSFVGGTGDGNNGVSAMDYAPIGTSLTARKGYFFFDDVIVFTAAAIRDTTAYPVETIVEQRPLDGSLPVVVDGVTRSLSAPWNESIRNPRWIAAGGVGYYFPEPVTIEASRQLRTGSWSLLASGGDGTPRSNPILTLWINHGSNVFGASTSYAVVPNVDGAAMRAWTDSLPITILSNNEFYTGVRDNRTKSTGVIFWAPGSVGGINADTACVVYVSESGSRVVVAAADPKQGTGTMKITLPDKMVLVSSDRPVTVTSSGRATILQIQRSGGVTTRVTLARMSRGRPARR